MADKKDLKKAVPAAMAAIMAMGGLFGVSAFFTDQANINSSTKSMPEIN